MQRNLGPYPRPVRFGGPLLALGVLGVFVAGAAMDEPDAVLRGPEPTVPAGVHTARATTSSSATSTTATPRPRIEAVTTAEEGETDAVAADDRSWVWHQLALCESGQRWDVVREVYQGGLQFDARTWDRYVVAHPGFPADADDATPDQQIAVAEDVLASEGPNAWPTCGPRVLLDVYTEFSAR